MSNVDRIALLEDTVKVLFKQVQMQQEQSNKMEQIATVFGNWMIANKQYLDTVLKLNVPAPEEQKIEEPKKDEPTPVEEKKA